MTDFSLQERNGLIESVRQWFIPLPRQERIRLIGEDTHLFLRGRVSLTTAGGPAIGGICGGCLSCIGVNGRDCVVSGNIAGAATFRWVLSTAG